MRAKQSVIATLIGAALLVGAVQAQAARPCRKMCHRLIKENIAEHCSGYRGVIKRACKKDVRDTIVNFCQRQESGPCLGD
jgi:hypothetical protein